MWTCTTCRARVRDTGPFASHPDDRETGHLDDCARRAAALEAWRARGRRETVMSSRRPTPRTAGFGAPAHATTPLLFGVELVRADVAATVLGLALGDAPCGGPITWALFVDAALVGRTDEAMTDEAAQVWAKRLVGDGARFQLARPGGGYWLADASRAGGLASPVEGGWSR